MKNFLYLFLLSLSINSTAQKAIDNEWLVQLKDNYRSSSIDQIPGIAEVSLISESTNVYRVKFNPSISNQERTLIQNTAIVNYQANLKVQLRNTPNDELFDDLWNLVNIDALRAWDVTTGGKINGDVEIVVAVIDEGFDIAHEDLAENIWINQAEIPDNGLDDDANGYVDDISGANLSNDSGDHLIRRHGTAVAGIIGAKGNNEIGVTGLNWDVKMMVLSNVTNVGLIVEAYEYVYQQRKKYNDSNGTEGAYVVVSNLSLGVSNEFGSNFPIWCNMYDQLGSVGVLNVGSTDNANRDVGENGDLPSTCASDHLIVVTNSTELDELDSGAAYSNIWVDIAAPGNVVALDIENRYKKFDGTSGSCPHVSGTVALLYSAFCQNLYSESLTNPTAASLFIKDAILNNVDVFPAFQGITTSDGRLNVYNALNNLEGSICGASASDELEVFVSHLNYGSQVNLEIHPNIISKHKLSIFDFQGRLIAKRDLGVFSFGKNIIRVDLKNLTPGIIAPVGAYIFLVENDQSYSSKKVLYFD